MFGEKLSQALALRLEYDHNIWIKKRNMYNRSFDAGGTIHKTCGNTLAVRVCLGCHGDAGERARRKYIPLSRSLFPSFQVSISPDSPTSLSRICFVGKQDIKPSRYVLAVRERSLNGEGATRELVNYSPVALFTC